MTRSFLRTAFAASLFSLLASNVAAQAASSSTASATTAPKAIQTLGCYSKADPLVLQGAYTYQTSGYCQQQCAALNKLVMAITAGSTCYCGDEIPAQSNQVDESKCNSPCNGFDQQNCGGQGYWQVYLTGLGDANTASGGSSSSTSGSSSTSAQPSVVTKAGQTVVVTASSSSNSGHSGGGGGGSKVGIAVGVVVGLIAVAAIIGAAVLFLKRRRRQAIEEEHRRNAAVSSFVAGGKSETSSATDQRLDPSVFSHRRQSIGSIADERDFSRRILQVRNPDRDSKASAMA